MGRDFTKYLIAFLLCLPALAQIGGGDGRLLRFDRADTQEKTFHEFLKDLEVSSTGYVLLPSGTTAQRPSVPGAGMIRYNSELSTFEGYTDEWGPIAGGGGLNKWAPSIDYEVGDVIWEGDSQLIYAANTAHTSTSSFADDIANWDELVRDLGELMLFPSFEQGHEGVATTATATLVPSDFHGKQALSVAFNAGGGTYIVDKTLPADNSRDNVAHKVSCAISATAAGGKFLLRSNGATVGEVDVDNITGEPQQYTMLISGTTSIGWGVSHDDETLVIDRCSITNDYEVNTEVYRNSALIDASGSGDFTGGSIRVERMGSIVVLRIIANLTFSPSTSALSDVGLIPEWARPDAGLVLNVYTTFDRRIAAYTDGKVGFLTTGSALTEFGDASITYSVNDALSVGNSKSINVGSSAGAYVLGQSSSNQTLSVGDQLFEFSAVEQKGFSCASNVCTTQKSGLYKISGSIRIDATSTTTQSNVRPEIVVNSASIFEGYFGSVLNNAADSQDKNAYLGFEYIRFLNAGDELSIGLEVSGVSSRTIAGSFFTITPVLNNETVAALLSTQYVSGGVEENTGDTWDGAAIFRRCYEVTSDITADGRTTIDTIGTGYSPLNAGRIGTNVWELFNTSATTTDTITFRYVDNTGVLSVFLQGARDLLTGSRFCMEYTK